MTPAWGCRCKYSGAARPLSGEECIENANPTASSLRINVLPSQPPCPSLVMMEWHIWINSSLTRGSQEKVPCPILTHDNRMGSSYTWESPPTQELHFYLAKLSSLLQGESGASFPFAERHTNTTWGMGHTIFVWGLFLISYVGEYHSLFLSCNSASSSQSSSLDSKRKEGRREKKNIYFV